MKLRNIFLLVYVLSLSLPVHATETVMNGSATVPEYETVTLNTKSGRASPAAFFAAAGKQAVVFVPGAVFDKESWFDLTERLQLLNITSLSLDGKTPDDVTAAIDFLKENGFTGIALVGGSMGGAAILDALQAGVDDCVSKVVLLAPAGGGPIRSAQISKLFIVSKGDGLYPHVQSLCEESTEPSAIKVMPGREHAQHMFKGPHKDGLAQAIVDFLSKDSE